MTPTWSAAGGGWETMEMQGEPPAEGEHIAGAKTKQGQTTGKGKRAIQMAASLVQHKPPHGLQPMGPGTCVYEYSRGVPENPRRYGLLLPWL